MEQILLNKRLMGEISELQQEALLIQEIPRQLLESVANCKDIYKDVLSNLLVKPIPHFCLFQPYLPKELNKTMLTICSFVT